jgi:beta-lactamase class A
MRNAERAGDLRSVVEQIADEFGLTAVAVAYHDYETHTEWSFHGERWFHAASTMKIPVLLGVFARIHAGELELRSRVHVRNRFVGAADGQSFRVSRSREADAVVHQAIGKTLSVGELARQMIVTSSNLATNLLVELIGIESIRATLDGLHLDGIEVRRCVEDEAAFDAGINNRVTAEGLLQSLRLMAEERAFSPELSRAMLEILHDQEFRRGIPAGLPPEARVAHKTGEISTVAHDAGIVYLPDREPYALVVLTEFEPVGDARRGAIAEISRAVWERITTEDEDD